MRIIFLGTPDFAVPSLETLIHSEYQVVGVVTAPDKPAGRGLQVKSSPVKACAVRHGIPVLQPEKLRDPEFHDQLKALKADIQIVVAFRMLPESVWNMPPMGTWNLHASLLPQYRGAAPINHAIINGERFSGISTFKLVHQIDEGAIALQLPMPLGENETAGELHDRMMLAGGQLLLTTLRALQNGNLQLIPQEKVETSYLKHAPKLNPEFSRINWNKPTAEIHNHIRGLSPYPTAHTILTNGTDDFSVKIFSGIPFSGDLPHENAGTLRVTEGFELLCATADGCYSVLELQQSGKKRLIIKDFLLGFRKTGAEMFY
jgi:methionyl-tRNA formyltransferase